MITAVYIKYKDYNIITFIIGNILEYCWGTVNSCTTNFPGY